MRKWLFLVGAIVFEVSGTLALRASLDNSLWVVAVAIGYVVSFGFLAAVLREGAPIGVAYGIWGASGVALTAVLARVLFDEPFTTVMGLGIAIVASGVLLVEVGSQKAQPRERERVRR
ncbi:DMT family transporter [Rhodococcus sp. NPDC058521]|uniref:DMT family transporter n=1 Tax=Rhodococcus sp. NPDC058521 TaxID=3346536 RepID=UPI003646CD37